MRVLIDTYVIIDALQSRVPFAEAALDEADRYASENEKRYTHEEVFSNLQRRVNG